jgi:hypothetical protein
MKKFWMIGLLALASANSFQTTRATDTRATADNVYKPIFNKLNVPQLPVDHINKAVDVLEKQIQGGQSNQPQISDSKENQNLIAALKKIKKWGDTTTSSTSDSSKQIVKYLSELGEVSSLLKKTKPCAELNPIAQHIIHIKNSIRSKDITSGDFGQINGTENIELIPLKFFNNGQIFANETLKKATVFELEKAMSAVYGIGKENRTNIDNLIKQIIDTKNTQSQIKIEGQGDFQKIEEAVNSVINSQGVENPETKQPAETNQKKEPEQKTPSRRQQRLANQNKGDKKGKKRHDKIRQIG